MATRKWFCLSIALIGLMVFAGAALAQQAAPAIDSLQVRFKVDSATKESLYMGEVWAAPAKFTGAQAGRLYKGEAKAVGLVGLNEPVDVEATWVSADPSVVKVTPRTGKRVKFTVLKPGQATVSVSYGNFNKKLAVKAAYQGGVMQVEISQ